MVAADLHDGLAGVLPAGRRRSVAVCGRDGTVPVLVADLGDGR